MLYFICPSEDGPSGGVRRIYRDVDLLNKAGLEAAVLHDRPEFRCTWFANDTHVTGRDRLSLSTRDILVFPELYGSRVAEILPGMSRVILNQGAYLTFRNIPEGFDARKVYATTDLIAVAVVSEDSRRYLQYAFPQTEVRRLRYGLDPQLWRPPASPAAKAIGYMPRRRASDVHQVIKLLQARDALRGWKLVPIDGLGEEQVAERLRSCALFLSLNQSEGFGLPPVEAIASGCHVIGFHGLGGAEYFRAPYCEEILDGDVVSFTQKIETFLRDYEDDADTWHHQALEGATWITDAYSVQKEIDDLTGCFSYALEKASERPYEKYDLDVRTLTLPGREPASRARRAAQRLIRQLAHAAP